MPANSEWRRDFDEDTELDEEAIADVSQKLDERQRLRSLYDGPTWVQVQEDLRKDQQVAFQTMLASSDTAEILAARERAKLCSKVLEKPDRLDREILDLRRELKMLSGELEEEEE